MGCCGRPPTTLCTARAIQICRYIYKHMYGGLRMYRYLGCAGRARLQYYHMLAQDESHAAGAFSHTSWHVTGRALGSHRTLRSTTLKRRPVPTYPATEFALLTVSSPCIGLCVAGRQLAGHYNGRVPMHCVRVSISKQAGLLLTG